MIGKGEFFSFAADVFGVSPENLSFETVMGALAEWDSIAQLNMVASIHARFGVEIPFADVPNVTSLWEFFRRINKLPPKKVIAVDLDNTLWHGVAAEDGAENVRANTVLQERLIKLSERGVLLVALSKNNENDVRGLVDEFGRFVTTRINWQSKAENLADAAYELNIGVDSFVFLDDNPAERLEMKAKLPEVEVAKWPPLSFEAYFPEHELTAEDRVKTEQYRAEALRRDMVAKIGESSTYDLWQELKAWLDVRELAEEDVLRVAQLSQKASQFSVLTNRYQEDEVRKWLTSKNERTFTVRAGDMFGEQGLVAFVRISFSNSLSNAEILDWTMSCRVAGRGLEERAWAEIERRLNKPCTIAAKWRRSQKNKPVENLFERLGFNVLSIDSAEKKYERVSR